MWGTYIYERLGITFLGNLVRERGNGIKGFNKVLSDMNMDDRFSTVFGDWLVTNYLHNKIVNDKKFRYKSISLPITPTIKHFFSLPVRETEKVAGYAVDYVKFSIKRTKNKKLGIRFESECPDDFLIKVVRINNDDLSNSRVEDNILSKQVETFDVTR